MLYVYKTMRTIVVCILSMHYSEPETVIVKSTALQGRHCLSLAANWQGRDKSVVSEKVRSRENHFRVTM